MGLLVPPSYLPRRSECRGNSFTYAAGEVVTDLLGIKKYEPPQPKAYRSLSAGGSSAPEVPGFVKYTDIENLLRWPDVLEDGEPVVLMEKIHGANFRCGWKDGKFHIGSHSTWRATDGTMRCPRCKGVVAPWYQRVFRRLFKPCPKCEGKGKLVCDRSMGDVWNRVATARLLKELLEPFPGVEIFGEVYGASVQDLNYGFDGDKLGLYIFDAYDSTTGRYWDYHRLLDFLTGNSGLPPPPPIIYRGPWDARLKAMAQGQTLAGGDHIREGFVVRPVKERFHPRLGRVILKCISPDYLLRKGGTEGK